MFVNDHMDQTSLVAVVTSFTKPLISPHPRPLKCPFLPRKPEGRRVQLHKNSEMQIQARRLTFRIDTRVLTEKKQHNYIYKGRRRRML